MEMWDSELITVVGVEFIHIPMYIKNRRLLLTHALTVCVYKLGPGISHQLG